MAQTPSDLPEQPRASAPTRRGSPASRHGMPDPPAGFAACRVHDGRQSLLADGATRQVTHLVELDEEGNNMGRPTVCGLTRFDSEPGAKDADLPGWSMGGGIYGPDVEQVRCEGCWYA